MNTNAEVSVGDSVRLTKGIWDDGEDHHPPGWLAQSGEVLIVKGILGCGLAVAHEGNPGSFLVYHGEFEPYNAEVTRR